MNPNWGGEDTSKYPLFLEKRKAIDAVKIVNLP